MKRANHLLLVGMTGLATSSVVLLLATSVRSKFEVLPIWMPFLVFWIMGLTKEIQHVKK